MRKMMFLLALLAIVFVVDAKNTLNYVEENQVSYQAMDPEQLDAWLETDSHHTIRFSTSMVSVPSGTHGVHLFIYNPVLSSYTYTVTPAANKVSSNGNYIVVWDRATQTISGTTIEVKGYCPAVGREITKRVIIL